MNPSSFSEAVCLGLSPMAPPNEEIDGDSADAVQRIVNTLYKALEPKKEHCNMLNALSRHILDASRENSNNTENLANFGDRVDRALTHRFLSLRNSIRQDMEQEFPNRSRARSTAYAKSEAEKVQIREMSRALNDVSKTNDTVRSVFSYLVPRKEHNNIPPLHKAIVRVDIIDESNKAASSKKSLQLLKELIDDPMLDPENLPRIVKNRLAAHYSITRRVALARATRRELRNELVELRALSMYAIARTNAELEIKPEEPVNLSFKSEIYEMGDAPKHAPITPSEMAVHYGRAPPAA